MADMLVQLKNCASQLDRDRFEPVVGALLVGELRSDNRRKGK